MTISIAKQPTKRTAKGLIRSGADGRNARRDGRHTGQEQTESQNGTRSRPILGIHESITESLDAGLFVVETPKPVSISPLHRRRTRVRPVRSVESADYAYRPILGTAGRTVVHVSGDDAWNLRVRR